MNVDLSEVAFVHAGKSFQAPNYRIDAFASQLVDVGEIRKALAEGVARGKLVIFDPLGEQLVRVMPMSETTTSPQHVPWDLPDIPVPGLEVQKLDDVELIKD